MAQGYAESAARCGAVMRPSTEAVGTSYDRRAGLWRVQLRPSSARQTGRSPAGALLAPPPADAPTGSSNGTSTSTDTGTSTLARAASSAEELAPAEEMAPAEELAPAEDLAPAEELRVRVVVNCAGLYADVVHDWGPGGGY